MITKEKPSDWRDLQNRVGEVLSNCGFNVQVEKKLETVRGKVEVDVYAEEIINGRKYSIICECKRWNSNIPQEKIHALRSVLGDSGTNKGYFITTSRYQAGAKKTAESTNIVLLNWEEFQLEFLKSWYENYFEKKLNDSIRVIQKCDLDEYFVGWFETLERTEKKQVLLTRKIIQEIDSIRNYFNFMVDKMINKDANIPRLPLNENFYKSHLEEWEQPLLPKELIEEEYYTEFLKGLVKFMDIKVNIYLGVKNKYNKE